MSRDWIIPLLNSIDYVALKWMNLNLERRWRRWIDFRNRIRIGK